MNSHEFIYLVEIDREKMNYQQNKITFDFIEMDTAFIITSADIETIIPKPCTSESIKKAFDALLASVHRLGVRQ